MSAAGRLCACAGRVADETEDGATDWAVSLNEPWNGGDEIPHFA